MTESRPKSGRGGKRSTSFKPGQSGNPGGRPKLPEDIKHVRELAREHTLAAVESLVQVMANGSGPAKVAAANAILDRGWGKAPQVVQGDEDGGPVSIRVIFG